MLALLITIKNTFLRVCRWTLLASVFVAAMCLGLALNVAVQVFIGDTTELKKTTILAKMNEETSIYFADGENRIGSLFEGLHRMYVPIDQVPAHVINAIIASEDKKFYHHYGIDILAIGKAFIDGLYNREFRRGGSTLTQQTVKNILGHWEKSFARKYREVIAALQLERMYNKQQIMEYYLNQFHVAANGNGIGIAAQYYFNKQVPELTLVEAAFIAGSVKGPSKYNPFIKYTKEARQRSRQHAYARKNYVLGRMYQQGLITTDEYELARQEQIPYRRGKFRSSKVSLVTTIKKELDRREVLDKLNISNVNQLNRAGLKVITTLDQDLQNRAQIAMRRNLSRLETILQGFQPEAAENFRPLRRLEVERFYYGKVIEIITTKDQEAIKLDFGLATGTIPRASLVRYAKLLNLPIGHDKGYRHLMHEMLTTLKIGDVLFVEVSDYDAQQHLAVVELHKSPSINGGLIALDKGNVRAVISGFNPIGFNRALAAKRPPGSVFKSVVYYAALQLGWSILDQLDNERQIFPYQGEFYFPRPDHPSPYRDVSMLWAGIMSENIASVALAYNLVAKLSYQQFRDLMAFMNLLPEENEVPLKYHRRMARTIGVRLNTEGVRRFQLKKAVRDIAPDLVFSAQIEMRQKLKKIWWGDHYKDGIAALFSEENNEKLSVREKKRRINMLTNNLTRYNEMRDLLAKDWDKIDQLLTTGASKRKLNKVLQKFRVLPSKGAKPGLGYFQPLYLEELVTLETPVEELKYYKKQVGRPLNYFDVRAIWQDASAGISLEDVKLDGVLDLALLAKINKQVESNYQEVMKQSSPYDLYHYYQHRDFRIALGLNYLSSLTKRMGVESTVYPILSFPLGTNDVSAAEVAMMYQTFIDGNTYRYYEEGGENQLNFIKRIEDRFGNVLYEPKPTITRIASEESSHQMREILGSVVTHGTGRRARGELYLTLADEESKKRKYIRLPAFGKTGTTNDFTTSYFAGFLPYPVKKHAPLDPSNSYVIAAYTGYDLNQRMQRGRIRVYGGVGALPVWTDFAKSILKTKNYIDYLDKLNLETLAKREWGLVYDKSLDVVQVDLPRGLILRKARKGDATAYAMTNIARTGEEYHSEFALDGSVKALIRIPKWANNRTWEARAFNPFKRLAKENSITQ
ncbi:MAG: transglycosylase domain-containing protein [Pseudomonadota bacterium]|nr:transglycosylase domain-containing protein [Pseudomonadota bacterium]